MPATDFEGMRTLVVGIDGASLDVLADRGEDVVPAITDLLHSGVSGDLESQIPPWTPSAWPSIYTGVNPGKHGVFGFLRFEGYDWDVVNYTDVREHTVWELLSDHGYTSVVVNTPVTHPPSEFDGALVPGYVAPEEPACHPEGLLDELEAEIGEYRVYDDADDRNTDEEIAEGYEELVEMRGEAFRYLADEFDPDFGFLQFQQTDTAFHEHPENDAVVDAVYAAADREIAATLEACDPDVVLLVSDHGIGPYDGHEFRANSFLRDRGDVATTAGEGGMPSWSSIARNRLQDGEEGGQPDPSALERTMSMAAKVGVTSQRIETVVKALGLEDLAVRVAPTDAIRAASEQVDFAESRAYVRDRIELGVRINLEGREPAGVVPESEYESVRAELVDALSAVRTPDGEPVFESVVRREDVFDGPYLEEAPDIVVVPSEFDQYLSASLRDEQFGPPSEPWNHKLDGVVAAAGDVDDDASLAGAHIFDVAPTVLATFGLPAADRMDGLVLPVVDDVGSEPYPEYEGDDVTTEDEAVEDRLEDLGYLER
ncbi:alkaline phosphatase family protein [Natronomonas salina]|uniref:alkaline phosphatase family protein n=1 Tax=Natronomonas salina TaxID=1710540 RepID=UPI001FE86BF1|nr:alkaline phosphatase family protein [Natronomonas salina]